MFDKAEKLAIGTVQFGLNYGISNISGKTDESEAGKILELAFQNGIRTIDTARGYGSSEETLGKSDLSKWQIVTKFSQTNEPEQIKNSLSESLKNLNQSSLYGFIAHSAAAILEKPDLWKTLQEIKQQGLVKKIGYSLYTPEELHRLLNNEIVPDLVQIPYNILDRRFEPDFSYLKKRGVEVHIRSSFLQGIFFMDVNSLSSHFGKIKPFIKKLRDIFKTNDSIASFLLSFCLKNPDIDKVIFGVNSSAQLVNNLHQLSLGNSNEFKSVEFNELLPDSILLPSLWPNN